MKKDRLYVILKKLIESKIVQDEFFVNLIFVFSNYFYPGQDEIDDMGYFCFGTLDNGYFWVHSEKSSRVIGPNSSRVNHQVIDRIGMFYDRCT